MTLVSKVLIGFGKSCSFSCINHEVGGVDIVALHDPLKYFWLVYGSLLHEVDNLILYHDCVVHIVVQLYLHFILKLSILFKELFVFYWVCKVLVILRQ